MLKVIVDEDNNTDFSVKKKIFSYDPIIIEHESSHITVSQPSVNTYNTDFALYIHTYIYNYMNTHTQIL